MEPIAIVRYQPQYAAAVADMWNASKDSWGGGNSIRTAEQVRVEEENSDSLIVYLAMEQEIVVGYCSLLEYREDTGALYLGLLNVRPDYHGKKAGKMLVREALDETVRLGWPRLDLYTWEGNTKAVPLYKKCGFFWEDREDTTHLMNFIPAVLQMEALANYWAEIDWYADSTRAIAVEPDGRKENGFDYYAYTWEKGESSLRVEFERRGRGMRLIETDDYVVSATVEQAEPVFGKSYKIGYHIVNKSGKPLKLELQGENDRNITFEWKRQLDVQEEATLDASFFVGPVNEEQSEWRTCPRVCTRIWINGAEALFQIGVVPKFPANLSLKMADRDTYPNRGGSFCLDIENNFAEPAEFCFELLESPYMDFGRRTFSVKLQAKERTSIAVPYRVLAPSYYSAALQVEARQECGSVVTFSKLIGAGFRELGAAFAGENEQQWQLFHGKFTLTFGKERNELSLSCPGMKEFSHTLPYPKLGKPYSSELSKAKPERVEWFEERGAIGLSVRYRSTSFPQTALISHTALYGDGTVKHWYEAENVSGAQLTADLWLSQPIPYDLYGAILPYEGRFIEINDSAGSEYDHWDSGKVTEPWIFSPNGPLPRGICWPKSCQLYRDGWRFSLEFNVGLLDAHEKWTMEPIYLTLGGVTDWKAFRAFALEDALRDDLHLTSHTELVVNGHNPFVRSDMNVNLQQRKFDFYDGTITAKLRHDAEFAVVQSFKFEQEAGTASFALPAPQRPLDVVEIHARLSTHDVKGSAVVFTQTDADISLYNETEKGCQTYVADNGLIRMKVAPDFYPALYSMQYEGREWLSSGFPERGPKSWWNPYVGGTASEISGLSALSVLKETCTVEFTERRDQHGNVWQGLKVSVDIQKHDKLKGLKFSQYYLLLPGVPVVCHTVEIDQRTGTCFESKGWWTEIFVQPDERMDEGWIRTNPSQGASQLYRLGKGHMSIREANDCAFGSEQRKEMLQIVNSTSSAHTNIYFNNDICETSVYRNLNMENTSVQNIAPIWFLFTDDLIESAALAALKQIRFLE
ncbi:GNAT family N-acetyltransferase [Paenibacillus apiarius]|uniref:GNAT family N-acetyltransferase n=1 Tax=Paenibacillus apiarius TaxID=46240 RepID=A0ABT4DS94_9BACL|nr:GNAT family N-acetyltransferase [Paenibacillus apiarius]MCY9513383.1 GNAT family N-acetyltransferase [Paenibacillus apiarius]MCY9519645.1 GNAT family N-acetyltransferase [Paenibacillus apiarius]MCY9553299.1 GNAT family N-acetyltransferase [Paenibacillus apiarius]MCY9557149.1 GNAT family N-acetyltransferase [Paenibacillus apiarius]MCY9682110.1 GNAT family N-acetyltransferase [Paenibacillus apiarius]